MMPESEEYGPYFLATSIGNVTQGYCVGENESPGVVLPFDCFGGLCILVGRVSGPAQGCELP